MTRVVRLPISRRAHPGRSATVFPRRSIAQEDLVAVLEQLEDLNLALGEDLVRQAVSGLRAREAWPSSWIVRVRLEVRTEVLIEVVEAILVPRRLDLSYGLLVRSGHHSTSPFHREPTPLQRISDSSPARRRRTCARI